MSEKNIQKGARDSTNIQADNINIVITNDQNANVKNESDDISKIDAQVEYCQNVLISNFEQSEIQNGFIQPNIDLVDTNNKRTKPTISELIDKLQNDKTPSIFFLLGEFGTGKSWLLEKLRYELAKRFISNPNKSNFPVFFNLASINIDTSIAEIIKYIDEQNPVQYIDPNRTIYLLDSLDEAGRKYGLNIFKNFTNSVLNFSSNRNTPKILIACRKTFFEEIKLDSKLILNPSPTNRMIKIELGFWSSNNVIDFLKNNKNIPQNTKSLIKKFCLSYPDIVGRAMIASLLIEKWMYFEKVVSEFKYDEFYLFDKLIHVQLREWAERTNADAINRNIVDRIHLFIKKLALVFLNPLKSQKLSTEDFEKQIMIDFPDIALFEVIDRQVKTRTLLKSTENGKYYEFCHRAIWEFIVAKMVIEIIKNGISNHFDQFVIDRIQISPALFSSIAKQFIIPYLERDKKLNLIEEFYLNIAK